MRRSEELYRDRSQYGRIIVTLYPAGFIGLRLEKCRREETLSMRAAYEIAVQTRVMRERASPGAAGCKRCESERSTRSGVSPAG